MLQITKNRIAFETTIEKSIFFSVLSFIRCYQCTLFIFEIIVCKFELYILLKKDTPFLGRYIFKLSSSTLQPLEKINQKSLKIEVTDVNSNETTLFPSIGGAARALSVRQSSISVYLTGCRGG